MNPEYHKQAFDPYQAAGPEFYNEQPIIEEYAPQAPRDAPNFFQSDIGKLVNNFVDEPKKNEKGTKNTLMILELLAVSTVFCGKFSFNIISLFFSSVILVIMFLVLAIKKSPCGGDSCSYFGYRGFYMHGNGIAYSADDSDVKTYCIPIGGITEHYATISAEIFGQVTDEFNVESFLCNRCMRVSGPNGHVFVKISGVCTSCSKGDIAISQKAFDTISTGEKTPMPVSWGPCYP
ncbi:hypothetical protein BB559_002543 [Furculomyces boomerangus]|uniref:RlpA-like protein double-psi beta-barrel domain-containing protein n=2 Tax=Harpellales TaxID=61421 RepID=A0A2T9YUJ3_9FUNG|nr:hypothetical protein BB559_002543 [Furculomyces boomerangus]PWA01318.1 hypothetical protein BB558_002591 [Smittium angustum]